MLIEAITTLLVSGILELTDIEPPANPRGIYVTSSTANSKRFTELLDAVKNHNLNLIVFDIQTSGGKLAYDSNLPAVNELKLEVPLYKNLKEFIQPLRGEGIYTAARFVLFKQWDLAHKKPQWALQKKGAGEKRAHPFQARDGLTWLDPSHPEFQEYLFDIMREIAESGVNEIQFDYVRFPEAGKGGYIGYETFDKEKTREEIITDFIQKAVEVLRPYRVKVSLDLFGIVVWNNGVDSRILGQNVSELSKYVDVIYPMVYPSHFGPGFGGHRSPADEPYFFVNQTLKFFQREMVGKRAKLRPWLQAFPYRASQFGKGYVAEQIRAAKDLGIDEYALWSAGNKYEGILP